MTLKEQIDLGHDGRFTFAELVESDLSVEQKNIAEIARLEGIRRRWLVHDDKVPHLVKRDRVEEDIGFQHSVLVTLKQMLMQFAQERDQARFAAQQLAARVKRLEDEKKAAAGERKLIAPSGRDLRAVLATKEKPKV